MKPQIHMKKTPNSQHNLEKEKHSEAILLPDFKFFTKLQ